MSENKTMLLTSFKWDNEKYLSFHLVPVSIESPYVEVFYDPLGRVLVLFAKDKKDDFPLLHQLDEFGERMMRDKKPLMERSRATSFHELIIYELEEIKEFIDQIACNADTFDYERYLGDPIPAPGSSTLRKV